ncbi:MAG: TetR/AcrR family transcriptional regulator, partial [Dokdonella sp.]
MNPASAKSCGPGRPKDLEKRAAILQAAKQLFPEHGFDGTSMDTIAALAGVSKLTVYSHFVDKERLFIEAVREKCAEQMPFELFDVDVSGPIREQLMAIARAFFALVTSEESISLH